MFNFEHGKQIDRVIKFDAWRKIKWVFGENGKIEEKKEVLNDFSFWKFVKEFEEKCKPKAVKFISDLEIFEIGSFDLPGGGKYLGNLKNKRLFGLGLLAEGASQRAGFFLSKDKMAGFGWLQKDDLVIFSAGNSTNSDQRRIVFNLRTHISLEEFKSTEGKLIELNRGFGFPFEYLASFFQESSRHYFFRRFADQRVIIDLAFENFNDKFFEHLHVLLGIEKIQEQSKRQNLKQFNITGDLGYQISKTMASDLQMKLRNNKLFQAQNFLKSQRLPALVRSASSKSFNSRPKQRPNSKSPEKSYAELASLKTLNLKKSKMVKKFRIEAQQIFKNSRGEILIGTVQKFD